MTHDIPPVRYIRDLDGLVETRHSLARSAAQGQAHRIVRGAYADEQAWSALKRYERYAITVRAVAETRRSRPVLSHQSAAVMLGLPLLGWPITVHVSTSMQNERRSYRGVTKHLTRLTEEDVIERDGLLMTSVERTVLDLAATSSLSGGVMAVDRALLVDRWNRVPPLTTRERLQEAWERAQPLRAHTRTLAAIRLGETRAESPLESVSRVSMYVLGCPRPRLQALHSDRAGDIGFSDFDWQDYGAVGEADGDSKYLDPDMRGGKTLEQVMLEEKLREDRIRALPKKFARWRWETAADPQRLKIKLLELGLPLGNRWSLE